MGLINTLQNCDQCNIDIDLQFDRISDCKKCGKKNICETCIKQKNVYCRNCEEEKMYILVNNLLKMSPGKIASQVAHVVLKYGSNFNYNHKWSNKIVVLKAPEDFMIKCSEIGYNNMCQKDLGLTEVKEGSITAICLGVGKKFEFFSDEEYNDMDKKFRKLQTL